MRIYSIVIIALFISFFTFQCGTKSKMKPREFPFFDVIVGYGESNWVKTKRRAYEEARMEARLDMANQIEAIIRSIQNQLSESLGSGYKDELNQVFKEISKNLFRNSLRLVINNPQDEYFIEKKRMYQARVFMYYPYCEIFNTFIESSKKYPRFYRFVLSNPEIRKKIKKCKIFDKDKWFEEYQKPPKEFNPAVIIPIGMSTTLIVFILLGIYKFVTLN